MDHQEVMVVRFDVEGYRTFVNDSFCKLYGVSADKLLGRHIDELIPEEDIEISRP